MVIATHIFIAARPPDTPNAPDNVVGNANIASYVLETERMSDGAMLASKELVVWT